MRDPQTVWEKIHTAISVSIVQRFVIQNHFSTQVSVNRFAMVTTDMQVATILCLKSLER